MKVDLGLKRAYDPPAATDGSRILVERLWPRGVSKEKAQLDLWLKEIAPSSELRKWYDHDSDKWSEFQDRYRAELEGQPDLVETLVEHLREGRVTLIYAARGEQTSAHLLKEYVEQRLTSGR
nr:uncharacterized protein YeaO-like [Nerophis lumbriciformis]